MDRLKPDEANVTRALIAAYTLSNKRFPQTRFYFVIDFCRRLSIEEFRRVRTSGLVISSDTVRRLAEFGTIEHTQRLISRAILPFQINTDIQKMIQAVNDVFLAYSKMHTNPANCEPDFLIEVSAMKTRIDELGASEGYLDFISLLNDSHSTAIIRSDNTYLQRQLAVALGTSALARALEPQIVRPVWIRR